MSETTSSRGWDDRLHRAAQLGRGGGRTTSTGAPILAGNLRGLPDTWLLKKTQDPNREARREMEGSSAMEAGTPAFTDGEVAALRAGDERAFLALVERHQRGMVRVASLYVKSSATAEEVVQEAWIGVLRGLDGFEGRSSLKSWIFGILVNCAKARAVREGRTVPISSLVVEGEEDGPSVAAERFLGDDERWAGHWAEPPSPWPDAWVESREMVALVQEAMSTLPEAQRTVMSLRDVDGWESQEVCQLLGISEGNQRVLLHRARSRVRGYVEQRLGRRGRA